jgi:putative FmdB family regulatory protein
VPLYEYQCLANGHSFEVRHPITQEPVSECPQCGSDVRRVIHPVGIVFKGSGFYATDSKGKSSKASKTTDSQSDSKAGSDGKSGSETKTTSDTAGASKEASSSSKSGDSTSGSSAKPAAKSDS